METLSTLLAICEGISPIMVNSLHKGQWCRALMFSLICTWTNDWVNTGDTGDLRCHHTHYDVIVMSIHSKMTPLILGLFIRLNVPDRRSILIHLSDTTAVSWWQLILNCADIRVVNNNKQEPPLMPKYPRRPRSVYVQRVETVKQSRPWNSLGILVCAEDGDHAKSGLWSSLGTHGSLVVIWWLCISSSGETRKFDFLSQIWPGRSKVNCHPKQ